MKEKLAKLIDVKSLMTLALTAGFIGLTCSGTGIHEHFYYDCRVLFRNPGRESKKIEREERKMSCNVHGNKNANEVHNYSAKKAQKLGHPEMTVDPECTCDVGCTGPAKEGKGNTPVGPGAETKKPGPADECK